MTVIETLEAAENSLGRLMHYSSKPLLGVRSTDQEPTYGCYDKPRGLWISVEGENDWPSWCDAESFGSDRLALAHEITLAADAKIIRLVDALDIDCFTERYGILDRYRSKMIDWPRVSGEYQGIIIAPYVWSRRLHSGSSWYYGWDCASGCIWDKSAILTVGEPSVFDAAIAAEKAKVTA